MQDRVSLYPGRVTLTPVAGQANTYDMVRADQPTQEGTQLNKGNLLSDATAELLGLPSTAVPNDAFAKLGPFSNYVWETTPVGAYSYRLGARTTARIYHFGVADNYVNVYYYDSFTFDADAGTFSVGEQKTSAAFNYRNASVSTLSEVLGKYIYTDGVLSYIPTNASITKSTEPLYGTTYYNVDITVQPLIVESTYGQFSLKTSPYRDAYPDSGLYDGQNIAFKGSLYDLCLANQTRVEIGGYTGAGAASKTLTFGVTPKVVLVQPQSALVGFGVSNDYYVRQSMIAINGISAFVFNQGALGELTWGANALTMTDSGTYENSQSFAYYRAMNVRNVRYFYVAIG